VPGFVVLLLASAAVEALRLYRLPATLPQHPGGAIGDVIGSGRSSRLYDALVRRQQLATNVGGFNFGLADGADMLVFTATGKPGSNPDSLEVALMAELAGTSSFTQAELERARTHLIGTHAIALQRNSARAAVYAFDECYGLGAEASTRYAANVSAVSAADVLATAQRVLMPSREVIALVAPEGAVPAELRR